MAQPVHRNRAEGWKGMQSRRRLRSALGPLLILTVFAAALWLLHRELQHYELQDFRASARRIPAHWLWLAVGLTVLDYAFLAGYELLAKRYLQHKIRPRRVVLASFLGYALGHNFGVLLGGSTVRYRLYTLWGLSAFDVLRLVFFLWVTFAVGLAVLGAVVFLVNPLTIPERLQLHVYSTRPLGYLAALFAVGYLAVCALRRTPLKFRTLDFSPPKFSLGLLQGLVSAAELMAAAGVLYVLLPATIEVGYLHVLAIYLLAIVATFLSQVPGGIGVLELVILVLLNPREPQAVFGALLVYRLIFYLMPLGAALLLLGANELALHERHARKLVAKLGGWPAVIAPRLMTLGAFLCGAMLLFSAATPLADVKTQLLLQRISLPLIEAAHFLCALAGAFLLVLTSGLQRRVRSAYWLTMAALAIGAAGSLLKGLAYGELLVLSGLLLAMLPARDDFDRRDARLSDRFATGWFVAFVLAIAVTAWLFVLAYQDATYQHADWWQVSQDGHLARSLRGLAGAAGVVLLAVLGRLARGKPRAPQSPTPQDREAVRPLVERSPLAEAHRALVTDQRLLIHGRRAAFLMYGIQARSWIAWGDPVGEERASRELAWNFRELADDAAAWPVFYHVGESLLELYAELGLTVAKLGEVGRVHLPSFDWSDGAHGELQRAWEAGLERGCSLAVERRRWRPLDGRSSGSSDGGAELPTATVRCRNEVVLIAQLWLGSGRHEFAARFVRDAAERRQEARDFLWAGLTTWGQQQGYEWLNLGLAPSAGNLDPPLVPLWEQLAGAETGPGDVPDIGALRTTRQRFSPIWTPRYLAAPGGLLLPRILNDVAEHVTHQLRIERTPPDALPDDLAGGNRVTK